MTPTSILNKLTTTKIKMTTKTNKNLSAYIANTSVVNSATFFSAHSMWLILLRRYNVAFFKSKGKSVIISHISNCQSNNLHFNFRSYIDLHIVVVTRFFFEFSLRFTKKSLLVLTLWPFWSALCEITQLFLLHLSL